jgi:hypothetical protein
MQVNSVQGPEEGSVSVRFGCATCGHRVALLTNHARERGVTTVTPELMDEYRARAGF